jgi:hypothetical protein
MGNEREIMLSEAVENKLRPSAYSYDGQLEKLQSHIDLQAQMIVKLVTLIDAKLKLSAEDVEELLGYGYKVEE